MKKIILLAAIAVCNIITVAAQTTNNSIVVFSETGERFYLILNGVKQNTNPETNVKSAGLNQATYKAKIIFADRAHSDVDKTMQMMWAAEPVSNTEFVYSIARDKKGKYKIKFVSQAPVSASTYVANNNAVNPALGNTNTSVNTNTGVNTNTNVNTNTGTNTNTNVNTNTGNNGVSVNTNVNGTGMNTNTTTNTTTNSTTTTTNGTGNTGANINIGVNGTGMNMSVNVNDGMGGMNTGTSTSVTSQTTTTSYTSSTTTNGVTNTQSGSNTTVSNGSNTGAQNVNMNVNVNGTGTGMNTNTTTTGTATNTTTNTGTTTNATATGTCGFPMSTLNYDEAKKSIRSKTFEDSKYTVAQQVADNNCLNAEQIKGIMQMFTHEATKLDFAKYCYDKCYDKNNYYKINDAFGFETSIDELNEYIKTRK